MHPQWDSAVHLQLVQVHSEAFNIEKFATKMNANANVANDFMRFSLMVIQGLIM